MATLVTLTLIRPTEKTPWGFRLGGGADYKTPLVVQKVTGESIASKSLSKGDVIIMLQDEDARGLCHFDACDLVKNSGRQLNMTVRKASSNQYMYQENSFNLQRLEQSLVQGRIQQETERRNRRSLSKPPVNEVTSPKMVESPIYSTPEHSLVLSPPIVLSMNKTAGKSTPPFPNVYSPRNNPLSPPVLKLKLNRNNLPSSPSISESSTQQLISSGTKVHTPNPKQNECFSEFLPSPCNEETYFNPFLNQYAKNNLGNNSNQCHPSEPEHIGPIINADGSSLKNDFRSMERLNSVSSNHNYEREVTNDPEEIAKRTQLQQLIQEKLRLEEKMMIAKRRQSESKSFGSLKDINSLENVSVPDNNSNKVNSNKIVKSSQSEETISSTIIPTKNLQMKDNKESTPVLRLRTIKIGPPASMRTSFNETKCHENDAKHEAKVIPISNCMSEGEQLKLREENRIRDEQIRKMQEHNYDEKRNKNSSKNSPNPASNEAKKKKEMTNVTTDGKPLVDEKFKKNPVNSNQNVQSPNVTESIAREPDNSDSQKLKISKEDKRRKELKALQEQFKKDQIIIQEEIMKRKCKIDAEQKLKQEEEEKKRAKEEQQKQVIMKIIKEEENKLLERKKILEEKMKMEKLEEMKEKDKVTLSIKTEMNTKLTHKNSKTIKDSYQVSKMKTYEQQRIAMQKVVQRQHEESARQLNDKLKQQSHYYSEANIYEDVLYPEHKEEELYDLKKLETIKMREEQENYRELLEEKRQSELQEPEDFISENGNARSFTGSFDQLIEHEEQFEELTATSEEELLEAQEKSIRNLNRQLKQQEEKSKQRSNCSINDQYQSKKSVPVYSHRQYASTGDLRRSDSRTLPVTKFNPDPMEFGFKPIESPILSKSLTNIEADTSIVVNPSGSEIEDGVKTFGSLSNITDFSNRYGDDGLWRSHSMSTSLGNLEQVYSKPPLPFNVKRERIRHTASEEVLASTQSKSPPLDENDRFISLRRRDSFPCDVHAGEEENYQQLESYNDFNSVMSEYYSSYYEAYYQNYYMRQQEELKSGKSKMHGAAGPPPAPPPPPFVVAGMTPYSPPPQQVQQQPPLSRHQNSLPEMPAPPAALAGAMMKDKKPFTYTPGGLDLSEIRSSRMQRRLSRNAAMEGVKPIPQQNPSSPGGSPAVPSAGIAVQVLPMPGMTMTKPASSLESKEKPQPKKEPVKPTCGPAPPPPPFAIGNSYEKPIPSNAPSITASSSPSVFAPSSLPESSSPERGSPSISLSSTNDSVSANIPIPPQPPAPKKKPAVAVVVRKSPERTLGDLREPVFNQPEISKADIMDEKTSNTAQFSLNYQKEYTEPKINHMDKNELIEISSELSVDDCVEIKSEKSDNDVNFLGIEEDSKSNSFLSPFGDSLVEELGSTESLLKQISDIEKITSKHHKDTAETPATSSTSFINSNLPELFVEYKKPSIPEQNTKESDIKPITKPLVTELEQKVEDTPTFRPQPKLKQIEKQPNSFITKPIDSDKVQWPPHKPESTSTTNNVNARFIRQGSVPAQQSSYEEKRFSNQNLRANIESTSVLNLSPTSGLIKAPLPWMSAVDRSRETSAPPEFVNYAQNVSKRLQNTQNRKVTNQLSRDNSRLSPPNKEAVVASSPLIYSHPGEVDIKPGQFSSYTLPRKTKLGEVKTLSAPMQKPFSPRNEPYKQPVQQQTYMQPNPMIQNQPLHSNTNSRGLSRQKSLPTSSNWATTPASSLYKPQQPVGYSREQSTNSNSKVRVIPIMIEQEANSNFGNSQQIYANTSYRKPQAHISPIPPKSQIQQQPPSYQQPNFLKSAPNSSNQKMGTRNLYSDANALDALQQMQQSLEQLNSGILNAYPKVIQEKMSNTLPNRNVYSPPSGPQVFVAENAAPIQSKSFRLLQNVVAKDQMADGVSAVHAPTYGKQYQQTPKTNQGYSPVSRGPYSNSNAVNVPGESDM